MVKKYRILIFITIVSVVFYILNKLLFFLPDFSAEYKSYHYSLEVLYLFFLACALAVLAAVIIVNKRSPDNTGFAYVGGTLIQMGLCYAMLRPILNAPEGTAGFEKANFFIIFLLFLATETILAIQILNKKQ